MLLRGAASLSSSSLTSTVTKLCQQAVEHQVHLLHRSPVTTRAAASYPFNRSIAHTRLGQSGPQRYQADQRSQDASRAFLSTFQTPTRMPNTYASAASGSRGSSSGYERQTRTSVFDAFPTVFALSFGSLMSFQSESEKRMNERLKQFGFEEKKIAADGNCLFRALADQLANDQEKYKQVRKHVVKWLRDNEHFDVSGDGTELHHFLERDRYHSWQHYCNHMEKDGSWGDHLVLKAAAEVFKIKVWVLTAGKVDNESQALSLVAQPSSKKADLFGDVFLSHWPEVHYNSLVKKEDSVRSRL